MEDNFLSRWARRKAQAEALDREPAEDGPAPSVEPAMPARSVADEIPIENSESGEPEMTADEIAALPALETLDANSDFTAFLRRGVPAALKSAALRRLWVSDPGIRNFVGDARDYAWDWNLAGDVPGNGPLAPDFDVQGMVRKIFGDRDASAHEGEAIEDRPWEEQQGAAPDLLPVDDPSPHAENRSQSIERKSDSIGVQEVAGITEQASVRKHGSAVPK